MKIKNISKKALAVVMSLAVLASALMLNTFSAFADGEDGRTTPTSPTPWTGKVADGFAGGDGSVNTPYQIATAEEFAYFGKLLFTEGATTGKYFELTNDIYLNDINSTAWQKLMADNEAGLTKEERATLNEWNVKTGRAEGVTPEFNGHFDGDYHVIKGFYTNSNYKFMSIFGKMGWGFRGLKNLGIESSYISSTWDVFSDSGKNGTGYVAPFFSNTHNVLDEGIKSKSIENCYAADSVILKGQLVGCFIGLSEINLNNVTIDVEIKNCYTSAQSTSTATVWGGARHASFIAAYYYAAGFKFTNCYSTCNLPIFTGVDGGNYNKYNTADNNYRASTSCTNCYALQDNAKYPGFKKLTSGYMYGLKAENSMSGLFGTDSPWVALLGNTPKLKAFGYEVLTMWDGETTYAPMTASDTNPGTEKNPYLIYDAAELAYVANLATTDTGSAKTNNYYCLKNDIYLNDITTDVWNKLMAGTATEQERATLNNWTYGGYNGGAGNIGFKGHLNGNNYAIKGVYLYNTELNSAALLRGITGGSIENLSIKNSYYESTKTGYIAPLVGYGIGAAPTIRNCYVAGDVAVKAPNGRGVGLICQHEIKIANAVAGQKLVIENCYTEANITAKSVVSILGSWYFSCGLEMKNCYGTQNAALYGNQNNTQANNYATRAETAGKTVDVQSWFENCYSLKAASYNKTGSATINLDNVTVLTLADMKGANATTAMARLFTNGANSANWFVMTGKTPELFCFSGRTEIKTGDVNVDDKVDLLDLVDYARARANVAGVVINESNNVITGTFKGNTKAALKRNLLGARFDEISFPTVQ